MILEIAYTYQEDKQSEVHKSWVYFTANTEDFKKAVSEAGKYFKRFKRDNGWTSKAKLTDIRVLKNETDPVPIVRVVAPPKPRKSRRKSTPKPSSRSLPSHS